MNAARLALPFVLLALLAAPVLAQGNTTVNNNYNNPTPAPGGTPQINVNNPTPVVNVNNPPQESSGGGGFVGIDGTTMVIILVLAILVIAVIVGFAGRERWW